MKRLNWHTADLAKAMRISEARVKTMLGETARLDVEILGRAMAALSAKPVFRAKKWPKTQQFPGLN